LVCGVSALVGFSTPSQPTVVIGYENNGADPEMVSIAEHFFATDMHAHVELRLFSSGPVALAALGSGSLDFMTGIGNPPTVAAIGQGVPLKVIWAQEQYTTDEGLVVKDHSGIKTLADLKGQRVALVVGSTSPFELTTALKAHGINPDRVTFINTEPPAMVSAWERGSIEAAYVWDPVFDTLLAHGGHALMYDANVAKTAPIFNLAVVNGPWAGTHVALVREFIAAEQAGVAYYHQHPASAIRDMAREAGISVELAKAELSGYHLYNARTELSALGLGQGPTIMTSLVTRSLTSAARYLDSIGSISQMPKNLAADVDPSYDAYVVAHPKG
jgi:NitT/TauT family transport system substrate-binding protein/taurine transport system substrate-binding protein